jgi:UDP-N-acetylmuramate: L-alanyl-gamma-D-glutamyl-meso-diaminopimelate ligase
MGALAGLLKEAGHEVRGSDRALYPPMSEQLEALRIPVFEGFAAENLDWGPDVVVVGNVCRKDHVEVVAAQKRELPLTSFPAVLGEHFLAGKHSIVVSGTHGKTTTTSLLAHLLIKSGRDPSCFVGGVILELGRGYRLGKGEEFVVEGDEYDSAFFDKGSKFLHYQPRTAILTSVELDHVDIFSSMDEVRATFSKFVGLIPEEGLLLVAANSAEARDIADRNARCRIALYGVEGDGHEDAAVQPQWLVRNVEYLESGRCHFELYHNGELFDHYETSLSGVHNLANIAACIAVGATLGVAREDLRRYLSTYAGVARRQQFRGQAQGVVILDDYGHHPTAISTTLQGLRNRYPGRRLVALYEPRSATSRRRTFQLEFVEAFSHADSVAIGALHDVSRIPEEERFDPERLALELHQSGTPARWIPDVDEMVAQTVETVRPGDVVVIFSSGSFDGIHEKLLAALGDAIVPASARHFSELRSLLQRLDLDYQDLTAENISDFFVLENEEGMAGCVGLELMGEDAVLRSLAVKPGARGVGYGWMLADMAIVTARSRGVRRLYLVTERASDFFAAKHGFRVVDRSTVPAEVAGSTTFSASSEGLVPMRLDL